MEVCDTEGIHAEDAYYLISELENEDFLDIK